MAKICVGHSLREELKQNIAKATQRKAVAIEKGKTVDIKKGPAGPVKTSLGDLAEEFEKSKEWKKIEEGGIHSIPVVNFRLMENIRPDKNGEFPFLAHFEKKQKDKKDIDGYRQDETDSRIERKIKTKFEEMKETMGEKIAKDETKKSSDYKVYQKWLDIKGENAVIEAIEKMMGELKLPCLLIKGATFKHVGAFREAGLKNIPKGAEDAEADILLAYVTSSKLNIAMLEVKRPACPPWSPATLPDSQNTNKAEKQLKKDLDICTALLEDIPGTNLSLSGHSCFPTCSTVDLKTMFCPTCLSGMVTKDDLENTDKIKEKLKIPAPTPPTEEGKKLLLALASRLTGQASRLHIHYTEDKTKLEMSKHLANVHIIDEEIKSCPYIVLNETQEQIIQQFSLPSTKHLAIMGRSGSGKTMVCVAVAKAMARADKNTLTIVSNGVGLDKTDGLIQYLSTEFDTEKKAGNLKVKKLRQLGDKYGVNHDSYQISGTPGHYNHPAFISALTAAISVNHQGKHIVLMIDELQAQHAPLITTEDGVKKFDWRALSGVPDTIQLCLAFNPGADYPVLLPTDQRLVRVVSEIRYRSTISINKMVNWMGKKIGEDKCVQEEDQTATDVVGDIPLVIDTGLTTVEVMEKALDKIKLSMADQADNITVTMLVDDDSLSAETQKQISSIGVKFGWTVSNSEDFIGWEDDVVVSVGAGRMEYFSRARLALYVVLGYQVEKSKKLYEKYRDAFSEAGQNNLVRYEKLDS